MPHVRRPLGLLMIALLLAAVFALTLPGTAYWQRVLQDAGHGVVFAGVAVVLLAMRSAGERGGHRREDFLSSFAVAVVLGIATELLQRLLPNRDVSALDVLHDGAGAALGLAIVALAERRGDLHAPQAGTLLAVLLGGLVLVTWEPLRCARTPSRRSPRWVPPRTTYSSRRAMPR